MFDFFKDIKVIKEMGALGLAAFLAYTLYKILTNDLSHLNASILKIDNSIVSNTEVLRSNTDVLRYLEKKIK